MSEQRIPVTETLRSLIAFINVELQQKQNELLQLLTASSLEQMKLLGISPDDGWRLDYENLEYVKLDSKSEPTSEAE